jgi:hypothetical protein
MGHGLTPDSKRGSHCGFGHSENRDINENDLQLQLNEKNDGDLQLQLGKICAARESDGDAKKLCTMEWKKGVGNVGCCCGHEMRVS